MELDAQRLINDILEQNKQLTLQLSLTRVTLEQLQEELAKLKQELVDESN